MSGLFGYVTSHRRHDPQVVAADMAACMCHRDYYRADHARIGQSGALGRVGIGLLNSEPQPVTAVGGNVTLALCGELYYQQQRKATFVDAGQLASASSDADLAMQVYLSGGVEALAELEGMFTIGVWDNRTGDLWIVNDRFGLYPHYYSHTGGAIAFAPEMKGVLAAPGMPRKLDLTAVAQYIRFQQLLGERTWFEDVQLLPPASILHYKPHSDRLALDRYWDWHDIVALPESTTLAEATDETMRLFQRAIDARIQGPLRPGVFLSGGLDGRAILGFARDRVPLSTFTFGAPGCRDVQVADRLAKRSGSDHHWLPMHDGRWVREYADDHLTLTEGQHSWMHLHGMNMLERARQHIDVNLSGWDGATVLGGYIVEHGYDDKFRDTDDDVELLSAFYRGFCKEFAWPGLTDSEEVDLLASPGSRALHGLALDSLRAELARTRHFPEPYRADYFYTSQHCRRSTQNMVVFTRSAIEVRCPYFDYDLVSYLYGLPRHLRSSLALQHAVITRRMPDLARIPNEKDNLPPHSSQALRAAHKVLGRARRAANRVSGRFPEHPRLYADYENYLRGDLSDWGESILLSQRALDRGLFNPEAVRDLWERHQRGDQLWTIGKVAPLMTLELVLQRYFDDEGALVPLIDAEKVKSAGSGTEPRAAAL